MAAVKKVFNNPIVVSVLVLFAVAFIFRDFIHFSSMPETKPSSPTAQTVSLSPSKTPMDTALVQMKTKKQPSLKHSASALKHTNWNHLAKIPLSERDPFSLESMSLPQQAETDTSLNLDQGEMPGMKLSAIVVAENIHYATINGHLLKAGEFIDGWKLVTIGVNRVQLRGNEGLLTLDINGDRRMGGHALKAINRKTLRGESTQTVRVPAKKKSIPDHVEDLSIYQSLFDSLKKKGIVPELPRTRTK